MYLAMITLQGDPSVIRPCIEAVVITQAARKALRGRLPTKKILVVLAEGESKTQKQAVATACEVLLNKIELHGSIGIDTTLFFHSSEARAYKGRPMIMNSWEQMSIIPKKCKTDWGKANLVVKSNGASVEFGGYRGYI